MSFQRLESLRANIVNALGVLALAKDVMPLTTGEVLPSSSVVVSPNDALAQASAALLPRPVIDTIRGSKIDTLIVLPIFDVGAIPFAALPVGDRQQLIDIVSVAIAPGFFIFLDAPMKARTEFPNAVVVANPDGWTSQRGRAGPLPRTRGNSSSVWRRPSTIRWKKPMNFSGLRSKS
jgi:hypothetical protein